MMPTSPTDTVYKLVCPKCEHRFVSIVRAEVEFEDCRRELLARSRALPLLEAHWREEHPGVKP